MSPRYSNKISPRYFSIKSGKHSTRTLSLVQIWVRFKKNPAKEYLGLQGGGRKGVKLKNAPFFVVN